MKPDTIVIAGSLAQRPHYGGHTWVFLQYLLGFRRLGFDVLFLDRLEPEMCFDAGGRQCAAEDSVGLRYLRDVMRRFGLGELFAVATDGGSSFIGLPRSQVLDSVRRSALFLNVMGFFNDSETLAAAPLKVFLDIDPGFGQMWHDLGLSDPFRGHDRHVTIGQNIGRPDCTIPTCGFDWVATRQPIVLEHWPMVPAEASGAFTSIATWRGPFGPVEYQGKTYGLRVHEFRKFLELPRLTGQTFELAVDIDPADSKDVDRLDAAGWQRIEPRRVAGDPWAYQEYIRGSKAEFMVAKNIYVQTRGGWFSDRSICYLASGKPVLAQDTGLKQLYPVGEGLLTFSTMDQAVAGVEEIHGNYDRHARAARGTVEECFDSDKVLKGLLAKLGIA